MNGSLEIKIILRNRKPEQADDPKKFKNCQKDVFKREAQSRWFHGESFNFCSKIVTTT